MLIDSTCLPKQLRLLIYSTSSKTLFHEYDDPLDFETANKCSVHEYDDSDYNFWEAAPVAVNPQLRHLAPLEFYSGVALRDLTLALSFQALRFVAEARKGDIVVMVDGVGLSLLSRQQPDHTFRYIGSVPINMYR